MALTQDVTNLLANVSTVMAELYKLKPVPQEGRFGQTARHMTRSTRFAGYRMHRKFQTQMFTRTAANASLEANSPRAGKVDTLDVYVDSDDLIQIQYSIDWTIPSRRLVDGNDKHAAWELAVENRLSAEEAIGEKRNQLIHQSSAALKGTAAATLYQLDATAYVSGDTESFVGITGGSISNFHKGEMIRFYVNGSTTDVYAEVNDVHEDDYYRTNAYGPGIICTFNQAECTRKSSSATDFDAIASTAIYAADDDTGYGVGFDTLFASSYGAALPYFSVADRGAAGYQFLIPHRRTYSSAILDLDTHFRPMDKTMAYVFSKSKQYRRNKGFKITDSIVAVCSPELVTEAADQAGTSSALFTKSIASNLTAARRKQLAVYGWEGVVLHHPNLPPILLEGDPQAKPDTIRFFEPSAWEWIRLSNKGAQPEYVPGPIGQIWHPLQESGAVTKKFRANGFVYECPFCDQPKTCYEIDSVVSS